MMFKDEPRTTADFPPGEAVTVGEVIGRAGRWVSYTEEHSLAWRSAAAALMVEGGSTLAGILGGVALVGAAVAYASSTTGMPELVPVAAGAAVLGVGGLGLWWRVSRRGASRWALRLIAVEGDALACYLSRPAMAGEAEKAFASRGLPLWPIWKVRLSSVERVEAEKGRVFFMNAGRVHVLHNRPAIADGAQNTTAARRHELAAMIEEAKAARSSLSPAVAPAAAPSPSTPEKGLSL